MFTYSACAAAAMVRRWSSTCSSSGCKLEVCSNSRPEPACCSMAATPVITACSNATRQEQQLAGKLQASEREGLMLKAWPMDCADQVTVPALWLPEPSKCHCPPRQLCSCAVPRHSACKRLRHVGMHCGRQRQKQSMLAQQSITVLPNTAFML